MKLLVYSHDTFGLGNLRRMVTICQYLLETIPNLSILLISGSPVLHRFRLPQGLDYIKLPCVGRDEKGELSVKYLGTKTEDITQLRSDLILTAAANFNPDLILVDKKPFGIQDELKATLNYLKDFHYHTQLVLLLRDILDSPEKTREEWQSQGNYQAIQHYYDQVLVVGTPEIFDVVQAYQFPEVVAQKVKFCGYLRRHTGYQLPQQIREDLQVKSDGKLVVVTSGGGEDGARLLETYLLGLSQVSPDSNITSLVITGTEMPDSHQQRIMQLSATLPNVKVQEFAEDINSYFNAADLIVSMGGYNTVCEILSLNKKAIVVPRIKPVQEQLIRAEKMSELGLFKMIHPEQLKPQLLIKTVREELGSVQKIPNLNLEGLPKIRHFLLDLITEKKKRDISSFLPTFDYLSLRQLKAV